MSGLRFRIRHLREKSPLAAGRAVELIVEAGNGPGDYPHRGRPYPRSPERYRELVVPFGGEGYLLLYELRPDHVRSAGIKHMREAGY